MFFCVFLFTVVRGCLCSCGGSAGGLKSLASEEGQFDPPVASIEVSQVSRTTQLLTVSRVKFLIKNGKPGRYPDGGNLYLDITESGYARWLFRYTSPVKGNRREPTLGSFEAFSLSDARKEAREWRGKIERGIDPLIERKAKKAQDLRTVDDLWESYAKLRVKQILTQRKEQALYEQKIRPFFGDWPIADVRAIDVSSLFHEITSGRRKFKATANKTLRLLKNLFDHGIKLGVIDFSPAGSFKLSDAGGTEKPRNRALKDEEISRLFRAMRHAGAAVSRENYLTVFLLLALGVRKMELLKAEWKDIDLSRGVWLLQAEKNKMRLDVGIPLEPEIIAIFRELKVFSAGSRFVFPARLRRRGQQRFQHVGPDTLNRALEKVDHELEHFVVHDFRRTCRSVLSRLGVRPDIAERYINHKVDVYDVHDFFEERRSAQRQWLDVLWPLAGFDEDENLSAVG